MKCRLVFFAIAFSININAQVEPGLNYVRENTILVPGILSLSQGDQLPIGSKLQSTTYFDGLGRPVQKNQKEVGTPVAAGSSTWSDIVTLYRYDAAGRVPKSYLPYPSTSTIGQYKQNPLPAQASYYQQNYNESIAYTQQTFELNPLSRVITSRAAGDIWNANDGNTNYYEFNNEGDDVKIWSIGYDETDIPQKTGEYDPVSLTISRSLDDKGRLLLQYFNNTGQLILKRIKIVNSAPFGYNDGWACTYYVYDDYGLLRYEIQPMAVLWLSLHRWAFENTDGGDKVLPGYCFKYCYDEKKRLVLKKSPGVDELYMVYDKRDRLSYTQDGQQRIKSPQEWTAFLFDDLDRPLMNILYRTAKSRAEITVNARIAGPAQNVTTITSGENVTDLVVYDRASAQPEYKAQKTITFTANDVSSFSSKPADQFTAEIDPTYTNGQTSNSSSTTQRVITPAELNDPSVTTILKYYFYDDYTYAGSMALNNSAYSIIANPAAGDPMVATKRTYNQITGTKTRILNSNSFLTSSFWYDEKGRQLQILDETVKGGLNVQTMQYDYTGKMLAAVDAISLVNLGYNNFQVRTKFTYDKIGRLLFVSKTPGSGAIERVVASYKYDEFGRLKTKGIDPFNINNGVLKPVETQNYDYNINGQLTAINKDYALKTPGKYNAEDNYFGMYIGYDNKAGLFNNRQLGGQAAGVIWNAKGSQAQRKYDYGYDNTQRLSFALYNEKPTIADAWSNAKMDFSVTGTDASSNNIQYDLNGNLLGLKQKGVLTGTTTPVEMDKLAYQYAAYSNQLISVTDNNTNISNGKAGDFVNTANAGTEHYKYDKNGNIVKDANKNIGAGTANAKEVGYNYLDRPDEIVVNGKGTNKYIYDADGSTLQKTFIAEGATAGVTRTYIGNFVFKDDILECINFEEGRIRASRFVYSNNGYDILSVQGSGGLVGNFVAAYDYFIKDNLGNTRAVVTTGRHSGSSTCTMETARASVEEPVFGKVDANGNITADNEVKNRFAISNIPGQTNGNGWTANTSNYVSRVGKLAGKQVGPNVLLKVMVGDKVSMRVEAFYKNAIANPNNGSSLANDVALSLIQAISGSGFIADVHGATALPDLSSQLLNALPFTQSTDPDANDNSSTRPKAYLSVLFFDEQFNFIPLNYTKERVPGMPNQALSIGTIDNIAPKNGYAFIYVSNSSNEHVYFDNLWVGIDHSPLIEEDHYYPHGLKIASISSVKMGVLQEGTLQNNYLYQGDYNELDEATGWNEFALRNYDAQTGRFVQNDPYEQFASGYVGMGNDPGNMVDPSGGSILNAMPWQIHAYITAAAAVTGAVINGANNGWSSESIKSGLGQGAAIGLALSFVNWQTVGNGLVKALNYVGKNMNWAGKLGHNLFSTKGDWLPFYKADLVKYANTNDDNVTGRIFENIFETFMRTEYPVQTAFANFRRNDDTWTDADDRNSKPDFTSDGGYYLKTGTFSSKYYPVREASAYEVKQKNKGVYLSTSSDQIKGHISNLASKHSGHISYGFRPDFTLITTYDVGFSPKTAKFALQNKVQYTHRRAMYRIVNGSYQFKFVGFGASRFFANWFN